VKKASGMILLACALAGAPAAVLAQAYPTKPVRFIVPFPPGGTSDVLGRIVAQRLTEALGRQVVVENRGGASGMIGTEVAAKSAGDGYTLLLTSMGGLVTNTFLYKRVPYDPLNDFAFISMLATAGQVLVVHPAVPARNVKELIALGKARPGQLNVGSGGQGTTQHIVAQVFQNATGVKLVHVPYKGGGLAVADVVGGQIEMIFADMAPAVPHVKSKRLRALAVSSEERSSALPEVPTMAESGVKAWFPQTWWALAAPRGTPPAIVARLNEAVVQFMQAPEVQDKIGSLGVVPLHSKPERVAELIKVSHERMGSVVKAAGIVPE
jgi:tripartite-type tricarboxylate transporter receptor subunit TctC